MKKITIFGIYFELWILFSDTQRGQATTKNLKSMPLKHHPAHAGLNSTKINNLVGFCVFVLLWQKINILPKNARILELRY